MIVSAPGLPGLTAAEILSLDFRKAFENHHAGGNAFAENTVGDLIAYNLLLSEKNLFFTYRVLWDIYVEVHRRVRTE